MGTTKDRYEKRAISLGGYGSLVPFHGITSFDPSSQGDSYIIPLPMDQPGPDDVLERLDEVAEHLDVDLGQGRLYYSFNCQDYGLSASGIEQLEEDLRNPFTLREQLHGTLEERYNTELDMHRPCFVILSSCRSGLFYLLLRAGKKYIGEDEEQWEIAFYTDCGIMLDQPVVPWNDLEQISGLSSGPIHQHATEVVTGRIQTSQQAIQEVYPLDQSSDKGDADIIGGKNPFQARDVEVDDSEIREAVDKTSHLTFRVRGGTVGFDKEEEYRIDGMSVFKPEEVRLWGHPLTICRPICSPIN